MIDDPIVIRKSRGALIVSSSQPTDPIQLVRQINTDQLEVHLKNGSKYIEDLDDADMQEVILEMMGYGILEVTLSFHCWPEQQNGGVIFKEGTALESTARKCVGRVLTDTPYMNSKFLSVNLSYTESEDIEYYDDFYRTYDVKISLKIRARLDMIKQIEEAFDSCVLSLGKMFCTPAVGYESWNKVLANSGGAYVKEAE